MRPDGTECRPDDYTGATDQETSYKQAAGHPTGSTFTIPADPGDADAMLGELGELATATELKRAAIVSTRVRLQESQGRPTAATLKTELLSPEQFAKLGIHGLRSPQTVRRYCRGWQRLVDEGLAAPVKLGDEVTLPDIDWGDYSGAVDYSTPPYYVPPAQPITTTAEGDDLGLGECPPRSGEFDESELSAGCEQLDDEGEEGDWLARHNDRLSKWRGKNLIRRSFRSMTTNAEYALEYIRGTTEYDRRLVLDDVNTIRAILDDIVRAVDGESFDDTLSRILDEDESDRK